MKDWRTLLIFPNATLKDAINILNNVAQRIALVATKENNLLGTITDGDVRRGLIKYGNLDVTVDKIMCSTPKIAHSDWSKKRILATMEKYQLLQIPIVNNQNQVIGLQTLHEILKNQHYPNPVFLMAGGFGSRLYPLTESCPKPLLKIGAKPILEIILERFIEAGFQNFFISTHYKHDMIVEHFADGSEWGVNIEYIKESKPLGTAGALGLLPHDKINSPLFVMNADLLTNLNFASLLDFHSQHSAVATMCVRQYEHCIPYGVVNSKDHKIISMVEKPVHHFFINAGIYLLNPDLVKNVEKDINIDMPTLLSQQIAAGNTVNMFPIHEYWLDIGRMEDFKLAQNEYELL